MAQYEHHPIYKKAYDLTRYFEKIVRNFSRYAMYTIRANLRQLSREVLRLIRRTNDAQDKTAILLQNRERLEDLKVIRSVRLRTAPLDNLSIDDVKLMLQVKDFFARVWYWMGKGLPHQYEILTNGKVVMDHTTGLTWQQSGSLKSLTYADGETYIHELNDQNFAGYHDWRLPTLEEAMSLMEPTKKHGDLFIDPVFDKVQRYIWTADKYSADAAWTVSFYVGDCNADTVDINYRLRVRAVRSGQ